MHACAWLRTAQLQHATARHLSRGGAALRVPHWHQQQVQAYRLAVEQRRNFELRIPCSTAATATGTGGTTNTYGGSTDALNCGSTASNASGPLPGLPAWGGNPGGSNFDASNSSFGSIVPPLAGGGSYSGGDSRRRSLGAAQPRYVRFQFRSVSSVASHMAPAVSIPPTLMSSDGHNYYWSTVDVPAPAIAGAEDGGAGYFGLHSTPWGGDSSTHGGGYGGPHGMVSGSGGGSHSSDPGSAAGHSVPRTTFSLLPEDNPFQDITIGSLLGWGSYGRVHRGALSRVRVWRSNSGSSSGGAGARAAGCCACIRGQQMRAAVPAVLRMRAASSLQGPAACLC